MGGWSRCASPSFLLCNCERAPKKSGAAATQKPTTETQGPTAQSGFRRRYGRRARTATMQSGPARGPMLQSGPGRGPTVQRASIGPRCIEQSWAMSKAGRCQLDTGRGNPRAPAKGCKRPIGRRPPYSKPGRCQLGTADGRSMLQLKRGLRESANRQSKPPHRRFCQGCRLITYKQS